MNLSNHLEKNTDQQTIEKKENQPNYRTKSKKKQQKSKLLFVQFPPYTLTLEF